MIDVEAAGVNFPDLLMSRNLYQYKPELPFVMGGELAGTVREAQPGSGFAPGDRVVAATTVGAFAPTVAAPADRVLHLPASVAFTAGACLPLNYLTMAHGLIRRGGLSEGETVLVHGAAGGIGTATLQLAQAWGARVISVVSTPEKADFVKALGSDEVVLAEGFKDAVLELTSGAGADLVVDPVGGDRFTDSLRCLAPLGRLLVLGFTAGDIPTVKVNRLLLNNIDVRGVGWGAYLLKHPEIFQEDWDRLVPLLEAGRIDPPVHRTYALNEVGAAVASLEERGVLGKAVVLPRT
nr:NADPH:quinone oxidoreductase family protein [Kineosporia rhizophila]